jgi:nitrous oxidase accessory protein
MPVAAFGGRQLIQAIHRVHRIQHLLLLAARVRGFLLAALLTPLLASLVVPDLSALSAAHAASTVTLPPLQTWIDLTPTGGRLRAPPGTYAGPAVISRAIIIDGDDKITVDGGGKGTVLTVRATGVTIRGLHLKHSGDSHDSLDSGLLIENGSDNLVENNVIDDVLFGVTLQAANDNRIIGNRIRSRHSDPADRGDGIRLWYSMRNRIENNDIARIRDITVSNSLHNRFIGNRVTDSRRALNLLFSHRTLIERNRFANNSTGITSVNSSGVIIRNNQIMHSVDASGAGIALKESGTTLVHGNEIIHCAVGLMSDSPTHPINRITVIDNRIAHNFTGISFYGERGGHLVLRNRFEHNLWQALVGESGQVDHNEWRGNYWDDYQGFDQNADGVGDSAHEIWAYADLIWIEMPMAKFFRSSPVLELLDFLERLAPFASPKLVLRDSQPQAHRQQ